MTGVQTCALPIYGMFRFSDHGVSERKLAIVEIQPNGFRTIQPVPDSFEN